MTDLISKSEDYGRGMRTSFTIIFFCLSSTAVGFQSVDINVANVDQIALLPGVGKRLAQNIADRRKQKPFTSLRDLAVIDGITVRRLEQIKHHVIFGVAKNKNVLIEKPPSQKLPVSSVSFIEFARLEERALIFHNLNVDVDRSFAHRARIAAWLPQLSTQFETDHGEVATQRSAHDGFISRGGREFGFGIRVRFDFDRLIFNKDELDVAKLALSRQQRREELSATLRKAYFRYEELAAMQVDRDDTELMAKLKREMAELASVLDSLSGGAFSASITAKVVEY